MRSPRSDRFPAPRRSLGFAAALAGAVSLLLSVAPAQAATSLSPGWLAQHTLAGSQCWILTNGAQAPYAPNATASSWSKKPMASNCLVWTAYGIGSNGLGTVLSVGDQNMRGRWTNYGNSAAQNSQAFTGSLNTYNDVAADGTTWVAVGNMGRIQRSTNDGVDFAAASTPNNVAALGFVEQHHHTWITGGGSTHLLWRSTNGGASWTDVSPPSRNNDDVQTTFQGATYDAVHGRWLAVGSMGEIWQSVDDGASWTLNFDSDANEWFSDVDAGPTGTVLVATAGWGRYYRSTDATSWFGSNFDVANLPAFRAVKAGPSGEWIIGGLNNRMYYSLNDGVTWVGATGLPSTRTWEDITYAYAAG